MWMLAAVADADTTLGCASFVGGPDPWDLPNVNNNWRSFRTRFSASQPGVGAVGSGLPETLDLPSSGTSNTGAGRLVPFLLDWTWA